MTIHIGTKPAVIKAGVGALFTVLLVGLGLLVPQTAQAAACGNSVNAEVSGGKAHWKLTCSGGKVTVAGWVEDTKADGQCANVEVDYLFNDSGDFSKKFSKNACPKGERENFSLTDYGDYATVLLRVK